MSNSISVVIPTCDRQDLLHQAIQSVLQQTCPPFEIIVVDNGTTRVTQESLPDELRLITMPSRCGASKARNRGVEEARGDYVAFLDDDDLWSTDYLELMTASLAETRGDMLVGRVDAFEEGQAPVPWKSAEGRLTPEVLLVSNPGIVGSNTVVRRVSFLAVGGYDESLPSGEDKGLALDMLEAGMSIFCVPSAGIQLRCHSAERLSDSQRMVKGLKLFLSKYRTQMTPAQRRYNEMKIAMHSYRERKTLFRFMLYAGTRLRSIILKDG